MYYMLPHILQCTKAIHHFTRNDTAKLEQLSKYTVLKKLENSVLPVVNHLGGSFIFKQRSSVDNRSRYLSLTNIHNFINFPYFSFSEEDVGLSIPIQTALNTNHEFIDYFYSKQQNSEVIIVSANYMNKVSKERVDINFDASNYANILDWTFCGDPNEHLELTLKTKTTNNDDSIRLSNPITFTFMPTETTDVIFTKKYLRTTMQIPTMTFSRGIGLTIIHSRFLIQANLQFLSCGSGKVCCLQGWYGDHPNCIQCPAHKQSSPRTASGGPDSNCNCPNASSNSCFACANPICRPFNPATGICTPVCPSCSVQKKNNKLEPKCS